MTAAEKYSEKIAQRIRTIEYITVFDILEEEVMRFNEYGKPVPISYAYDWAISTSFRECILRTLFDKADHSMYLNKQRQKKEEQEL